MSNSQNSKPTKQDQIQDSLFAELKSLIEETRSKVAKAVNSSLTLLYWKVGKKIQSEILSEERASYGEEIVVTLSQQLTNEFGSGFQKANLRRMIQMAELYPEQEIVATLSRQLSWSHFVTLLPVKDAVKRDFYATMTSQENWSVRTLRREMDSLLYERTAISKKPEKLIAQELEAANKEGKISPDLVIKDPYFLNFLQLKDTYSESDLETAILQEIESFLLEMGAGFSFIARQFKFTVDGDDFRIDLLFYHRKLKRLVAIDLKLSKFKPEHVGQMEFYLRYLNKNERQEGENEPIGLILCSGKSDQRVELMELDKSGIRVAQYLTELPPQEILLKKLETAIELAREKNSLPDNP